MSQNSFMRENNRRSSSGRFTRRDTSKNKRRHGTNDAESGGKGQRQPFGGKKQLYELIKVRLVHSKRLLLVNSNGKPLMPNMSVLVKVGRNLLLASTIGHRHRAVVEINTLPFVVRMASENDIIIDSENAEVEARAQKISTRYALDKKLQMKVLSADLSHDRKNITINFASDVRVDFREMVAFLSSELKLRVEMYQLGLRSGTGLLCGLGSCGESLCCGRFLGHFEPVAIKLLRAQGLATNPKRISGVCGRLYCCLSYEYSDYLKDGKRLPKKGRKVLTRWGLGRVVDSDLIREEIAVVYENGEQQRLKDSDFILADAEIMAKIQAGAFEFPLESARLYLNNDPTTAVEMDNRFRTSALSIQSNARSGSGRMKKVQNMSRRVQASSRSTQAKDVPDKRQDVLDSVEHVGSGVSKKKRPTRQRRSSSRPPLEKAKTKSRAPRRRSTAQSPDRRVEKGTLNQSVESKKVQAQGAVASTNVSSADAGKSSSGRRVRRTRQVKSTEGVVKIHDQNNEQRSLLKPDLSASTRPRQSAKTEERKSKQSQEGKEGTPRRRRRRRPNPNVAATPKS